MCGNASDPAVLMQAHIARAAMRVIATPDTFGVRSHDLVDAALLEHEPIGKILIGEHELALGTASRVRLRV